MEYFLNEKERCKRVLLLAASLVNDKRYDDLILLGEMILDDTISMRKSFEIITWNIDHSGIQELNKKLVSYKDKTNEEVEFVDIPKPIGSFIIENAEGVQMADGTYYHYSEVCSLLKKYKSQSKEPKPSIPNPPKDRILREGEEPTKPNNYV